MFTSWKRVALFAPIGILGMALICFLGGQIVMRLWNWLTPPLFGWHTLTFWQALAMLVLCRILFGGPMGGGGRRGWRGRGRHLSPEDRERFKQRVRERWGSGPSTSESPEQPW
jgi:hypothetical protein